MVVYVPTEKIEKYIKDVTQNLLEYNFVKYGLSIDKEQERQDLTRLGIIALLKLYQNIELTQEESNFFYEYPLRFSDDYKEDIEKCIKYIAFKIGINTRNYVNSTRNELESCSFNYDRGNNRNKVLAKELNELANEEWKYIERLDEYNNALVHAYVFEHDISVITPERENIIAKLDFNEKWFKKKIVNVKTK